MAQFYLTTTFSFATFSNTFTTTVNQRLCFFTITVVISGPIRLVQCRTLSRIFFARPLRFAMGLERRVVSVLLICLCFFGVICRFRGLFLTSLLANERFANGRFLASSTFCFTRLSFFARVSSNSKYAYLSNASYASTAIHVAFHVIQRSMISSIYRIICIRSTHDCVNNCRSLSITSTRLLRRHIALYL